MWMHRQDIKDGQEGMANFVAFAIKHQSYFWKIHTGCINLFENYKNVLCAWTVLLTWLSHLVGFSKPDSL